MAFNGKLPNCRVDKHYNDQKLKGRNKAFIEGFDWCLKWGVDNMFDNLDAVKKKFDIEGEDINLVNILTNHKGIAKALRESIAEYAEESRNDMIVSMIDSSEEESEKAGE